MREDNFYFTADDGAKIFVQRWRPDFEIGRSIVHIAHGMSEHGGRYARLAEALTDAGFLVYANDHRGHGRTAQSVEDLGYAGDKDSWNRMVKDLIQLCRFEKSESPRAPLILFGHSMGSFMTQQAIYEAPDMIDAAALSGPNGIVSPLVRIGKLIARFERLRLGKRGRSDLINGMTFDGFNKAYRPNRTSFDWLSRDEAEVDKYIADPYCGFMISNQFWVDFLSGITEMAREENRSKIRRDLPIYLFSGRDDQVNDLGRGCEALAEAYRKGGLENVSYKIFPYARHETLNELNREETTSYLIEWMECLKLGNQRSALSGQLIGDS